MVIRHLAVTTGGVSVSLLETGLKENIVKMMLCMDLFSSRHVPLLLEKAGCVASHFLNSRFF